MILEFNKPILFEFSSTILSTGAPMPRIFIAADKIESTRRVLAVFPGRPLMLHAAPSNCAFGNLLEEPDSWRIRRHLFLGLQPGRGTVGPREVLEKFSLPIPLPPGDETVEVEAVFRDGAVFVLLNGNPAIGALLGGTGAPDLPFPVESLISLGGAPPVPAAFATELRTLMIAHAREETGFPSLAKFTGLTHLSLNGCSSLTSLDALAGLSGLSQLTLCRCRSLASLKTVSGLSGLTKVSLIDQEIPEDLSTLVGLTSLGLESGVIDLEALDGVAGLTELHLKCPFLKSIDVLSIWSGLKTLILEHPDLTDLEALSGLRGLTELSLVGSGAPMNLEALARLTGLRKLKLGGFSSMKSLDVLSWLYGLTSLNLEGCSSLTSLDSLSGITGLTTLNLRECSSLTSLDGLAGSTALTQLNLGWCRALGNIEALSGHSALQGLDLSGCRELGSIDSLSGLTRLKTLNLAFCEKLTRVEPLSPLKDLTALNLKGWKALTSVKPLQGLASLTKLYLDDCPAVRDLDALSACPELRDLAYNIDPSAGQAVLAACAVNHPEDFNFAKGVEALPLSKAPDLLTSRLCRLVPLREPGPSAVVELASLIVAARARGEVSRETWAGLLEAAQIVGGPGSFRASLHELAVGRENVDLLVFWLETLSKLQDGDSDESGDAVQAGLQALSDLMILPTN